MSASVSMTAAVATTSAASNGTNSTSTAPSVVVKSATARLTLELCGFDAESDTLLLTARALECEASTGAVGIKRSRPESFMRREFADLQSWDRQLSRTHKQQEQGTQEREHEQQRQELHTHPFERLPTRRMRKLMEQSWLKHDTAHGWRIELQKNVTAADAWLNTAFRLLPPDQQRAFLDSEEYQRCKLERAHERADAQHARGLQQYFTSHPLVEFTLARVAALLRTATAADGSPGSGCDPLEPLRSNRLVWVEPSCGDGRFVSALLASGASRVVGVEIDSALCNSTRAAVREVASHRVEILECDFLASQRASSALLAHPQQQQALRLTLSPPQPMVCVIGNPPFGDRVETSPSADLIQRFFAHAACEWHAELIAFIVPERCARVAYTAQTLETLSGASACGSSGAWRLALSESLEGFHFEFRSTKRIKQPSALLVYQRCHLQEQARQQQGLGQNQDQDPDQDPNQEKGRDQIGVDSATPR